MRVVHRLLLCLVLLGTWVHPAAAQTTEVIADIRVHGNHVTPNDEVFKIAGITVGSPFTATTLQEVERRLRDSGKFDTVEVLKRFASIADPTQIALVLIVNEGAVRIEYDRAPDGDEVARVVRRRGFKNLMYLPILDGEDGYGLTYGLTTSLANVFGDRSRISVPLSWGGTRRAAVEMEKNFADGLLTRVELGAGIQRRENPAFEINDDRKKVWARLERSVNRVRLGSTAGWDRVTFGALKEDFWSVGADVALDTRIDPAYPRNAVWISASADRLMFDAGHTLIRTRLDGRGYLGLIGQTVLAVRATREGANAAQPRYLQPLLGGWSSLRGYEAGQFYGDIVATGSAELLVPISSPMSVGKLGVSAFIDSGVAYDYGLKFSDQPKRTGIGASLWFNATVFRLSFSVAKPRGGGDTRFNFGGGFTF
jgi:outer membrane protein assembly factor BamA